MHMLEQHQGKDHVSAQDQADENMANSGDGVYLAEYKGEYMEVSMESANQLTVSAGALWVNGRFCIVDPAETLTVDNGSSGMTEYDLVCVHWKETTATGGTKEVSTTVEETELVIVKGDPASSGATDPEISQTTIRAGVGEAWVPFARITKDGLTPSVAFIVDKLVPESKFRDSISQDIGVWHVRKYPDGYAEAYTGIDTTGYFDDWSFRQSWGSMYLGGPGGSYKSTQAIELPFEFIEAYDIGIVVMCGNGSTSCVAIPTGDYTETLDSMTMFPEFFLARPAQESTTTNLRVRRYIRGRWK